MTYPALAGFVRISQVDIDVATSMGSGFAYHYAVGGAELAIGADGERRARCELNPPLRAWERCRRWRPGIGLAANAAVSAFESDRPIRPCSGSTIGVAADATPAPRTPNRAIPAVRVPAVAKVRIFMISPFVGVMSNHPWTGRIGNSRQQR